MQYLAIHSDTTLVDLNKYIRQRDIDSVLNANQLVRSPNVGSQLVQKINEVTSQASEVDWQKKSSILNTLTSDSDVYEYASLLGEDGWKVLATLGTFPNMLKIPETVQVVDSVNVMGNKIPTSNLVYYRSMEGLQSSSHTIDPSIFNEYSTDKPTQILEFSKNESPFQWFPIPWGQITLYSSLSGSSIDIPVYPEEISDSRTANYDTMPDLLYQYEPWQIYKGSGPRSNVYKFHMHRDMWTGDHRDGKCNQLLRFCEANCYPNFDGASVNTATCTLYIAGKSHISGIITNVDVTWSGPIGLDGWYLECTMQINMTEVSKTPLTHSTMMLKDVMQ